MNEFVGGSCLACKDQSRENAVMSDVTQILSLIDSGDELASDQLLPRVYDELRRLASRELDREQAGQTLQPTALVHEAYVRLVDQRNKPCWSHRGHFYAAAAQAMRRILIERARRKKAVKHGGAWQAVPLDPANLLSEPESPELLALDQALTQLDQHRPDLAKLISLRFFAGLTMPQAAKALGQSLRTTERNWTYAKAWLLEVISREV